METRSAHTFLERWGSTHIRINQSLASAPFDSLYRIFFFSLFKICHIVAKAAWCYKARSTSKEKALNCDRV